MNIMRKLATSFTMSGTHKIYIAATKPVALWNLNIQTGADSNFAEVSGR